MATDSSYRLIMGKILWPLAPSFLIGTSSFLPVKRATIISRMRLKFGQIRSPSVELVAIELLEIIPIDLQWEKCCGHSSAFIFDYIFFILASFKDMRKCLNVFKFRPDFINNYGIICP